MKPSSDPLTSNPPFAAWFAGSKAIDAAGHPLLLHHGTSASFSRFRPLSHFGTSAAASDRLNHRLATGSTITAHLSIRDPIMLFDRGFQHTAAGFLDDLGGSWRFYEQMEARGVDEDTVDRMVDALKRRPSVSRIVSALTAHGFDGVTYNNSVEDVGSMSWAIFRPDQVWRVGALASDGAGGAATEPVAELLHS